MNMSSEFIAQLNKALKNKQIEEIIDLEPKNNLEKFIKGMSIVSRALSRKICNDNPLDFLDQIRELCSILILIF